MHGGLELFSQQTSDLCPPPPFFLFLAVFKGSASFQPVFNEPKVLCPTHYECHTLPMEHGLHLAVL